MVIFHVLKMFGIQCSIHFQKPNLFGIRSNFTIRDNTNDRWWKHQEICLWEMLTGVQTQRDASTSHECACRKVQVSNLWQMFPEQLLLGETSQANWQLWIDSEATAAELQCAVSHVWLQDDFKSQPEKPSDQTHWQEPVQSLQTHFSETKRFTNPQQISGQLQQVSDDMICENYILNKCPWKFCRK